MSGPCCFSGSLSEGTPAGTVESYGGVQTYVAPFTGTPDVAIVMIPDVFGFEGINSRLMADRYASKNPRVMCVVPNVFPNGAVPDHCVHQMHTLTNPKPTTTFFDKMGAVGGLMYHMPAFFFRNSRSGTLVEAEKCITYLRTEKNVKKVATIGYCWGGTACISLGQKDDVVDAFCTCHPSMPKMPDDLAKLKKPACFILPRNDFMIKDKEIAEITAYMKTTSLKHLVKPYDNMQHGFAIRGDDSDPETKAAKEDCLETTYAFIIEALGV